MEVDRTRLLDEERAVDTLRLNNNFNSSYSGRQCGAQGCERVAVKPGKRKRRDLGAENQISRNRTAKTRCHDEVLVDVNG